LYYLKVGTILLLNSISRKCGTSAILFTKPSTFVSTVLSLTKVLSILIYNSNPPSVMKTLHVVGDSSRTKNKLESLYCFILTII